MPPDLALLLGAALIFYAFRTDRRRNGPASKALLWPTLWYLVTATRALGYWLQTWGVPVPGGSSDPTEGSVIERFFYGILTAIGLWILHKRGFKWGETLRRNPWLTALIIFMALSILWSHYPLVSFKRMIKVIGSVVMACVVLTEDDPLRGFTTVLRRSLYVHLPMSIICIKYFRNIGVSFDWFGTAESWQGISTSKNVLGQVAMLGVVYFFWEVRRHWREYGWKNIDLLYLLMAAYLLKGAEKVVSMTAVSVCVFSLLVFLRIQALRNRPEMVRPFVMKVFYVTMAVISVVLIHSVVLFPADSVFGHLITILGRDITLTGRTEIWSDVYAAASGNPLFGVGFGGFWIGRLANIPWNAHMTWVLGQAHSGYADTYLQLGFTGAILLAGVLFTALRPMLDSLDEDFDFACFRITLFITIVFTDMTETVYLRGDHHLWLILMIVIWNIPRRVQHHDLELVGVDEESVVTDGIENGHPLAR
jgi:O-antigen ligase